MLLLVSLVPFYIFIPALLRPGARYAPELALDRALPLIPASALVYGALYLFLLLLPIFVVQQDEQIRRTVFAYLLVWITAYIFFIVYPTAAPRPPKVIGDGFAVWGLRALYLSDPPYNCFPSLHVAHSFVSALTCHRVHRSLGVVAAICATLVALSTLFTKQHYILDVIAGVFLAFAAYGIFLRNYPREHIPAFDRRVAPALALCVIGLVTLGFGGYWLAYLWSGETNSNSGRDRGFRAPRTASSVRSSSATRHENAYSCEYDDQAHGGDNDVAVCSVSRHRLSVDLSSRLPDPVPADGRGD